MVQIILYPILTVIVLLFLGYGITNLLMPLKLESYRFWLYPWFAIVFIIFSFVILSFLGFSIQSFAFIAIPFLTFLNIFVFVKKDKFKINLSLQDLIIFLFLVINIIFNLSPLIRRDKFMTSISLGNNDVIAYVVTADYLVNHSLLENFATPKSISNPQHSSSANLIQGLYRWGEGIISGFLLNIFGLQGYQYVYILQVVLFALAIPLLYLIFKLIYKPSFYGMILTIIIMGFNVNLLYILYHDFFGQVLYWGLQLFIMFFIFSYFDSDKNITDRYNAYDLIIGTSIAVLIFSYHEAMVFIIAPLIIFFIFKLIARKDIYKDWVSIAKIFLTTFLISSYTIFMAFIYDYFQSFGANRNQPIGWQLFRNKIPYANPFEALGFWSIHNFEPMPAILAIVLSVITVLVIIKGILKSKQKSLIISYIFIFSLFYYWTAVDQRNFFAYNRALTFSLPFVIILFSIGLISLYEKNKYFWSIIIAALICLEFWSAVNLNKRFIREHLSVDKSFVSILDIKRKNINEPIYAESSIEEATPLWKQLWTNYFLYFKGMSSTPTLLNNGQYENKIPNGSLILISKATTWFSARKIIFNDIIWNNNYYRLGHICNTDDCLMKSKYKLNEIIIGKNEFEDSLLINGWSIGEGENRWANEKESTLRLVTKDIYPTNLTIEASSLGEPQEITVYLDEKLLGQISVDKEWKSYNVQINYPLNPGVHRMKFIYSNGYRPIDVIPGNLDGRTLYVNFKKMSLE
ncbi:hypothetical protein HZA75_03935 [Candidatus Roizmanbacteria bacterium]|nr:hypothetical protein [Candidatus Roizmanbacteria bacterium]